MKMLSVVLFAFLSFKTISSYSQIKNNSMKMKNEIKNVIETFVKAGAERNVALYDDILHPDFRVIANRYPTPEKTSIISAEEYISLITKKVIGGTNYEVFFISLDITQHSATVIAHLKADKGGQMITFLLVQDPENNWKIITDMATQLNE